MKNSCIFLAVLLAHTIGVVSQEPNDIGPSSYEVEMLPASPEVESLGKFGNEPINKYNGTANINIPIYNITMDGLSIPLNLSYNTGGIRVAQEASWVGLGWNLSDGIIITREINGYDDLRYSGYGQDIRPSDPSSSSGNIGWIYSEDYLFTDQLGNPRIGQSDLSNLDSFQWEINFPVDFQPDLFSLSTPNGSCKFYLNKKGNSNIVEARVVDNVNFKITYDTNLFAFIVTDPDGFTYEFDLQELSTGFQSYQGAASYDFSLATITYWPTNQTKYTITAWRPSKINSPFGRELVFEYDEGHHFSFPSFSETLEQSIFSSSNHDNGWYDPKEIVVNTPNNITYSTNAYHNLILKEIRGDFGKVLFRTDSNRDDLFSVQSFHDITGNQSWNPSVDKSFNVKRLVGVDVINHLGEPIRKVDNYYSYFNGNRLGDSDETRYLRLKLDKVMVDAQEYNFSYFECDNLPAKDSRAIDFWGFYNGADDNVQTVPSHNRFYLVHPNASNGSTIHEQFYKMSVNGANRKSNSDYAKYGLLDKVMYPTKGITEYHYESNRARLSRKYFSRGIHSGWQYIIPDGNGNSREVYHGAITSLNSSESYNFAYQYLKLQQDPSYSLYDMESPYPRNEYEDFDVGGLRVAEVIEKDYDNTLLNHRIFEYTLTGTEFQGGESSGLLMDDLVFHAKGNGGKWEFSPENYYVDGTAVDASSGRPIGTNAAYFYSENRIRTSNSAQGSHIGYSRVIEKRIDQAGASNGSIVTHFENVPNKRVKRSLDCAFQFISGTNGACNTNTCWDQINGCIDYRDKGLGFYVFNYGGVYLLGAMPESFDYKNGKVKNEVFLNEQGDEVQENIYTYEEIERLGNVASHIPIMNWAKAGQVNGQFVFGHPYQLIDGDIYGVNKEHRLEEMQTLAYFDSGAIETKNEYSYGPHNQLVQVKTTDSQGDQIITKAYYPEDLIQENFMQDLVDENRTRIRIKSEVYRNAANEPTDKLLASQRTTYSDATNPSGIILPYEVITAKGTDSQEEPIEEVRQVYERYDARGNLLQYSKSNGAPTAFIWGYNKQNVVAQLENATYDDVESVLGTSFNLTSNGLTSSQKSSLRSGISGAMINTFDYKPLVGLTQQNNAREYSSHYQYDTSNRLKNIQDEQLLLVEDYEYGYASVVNFNGCTDIPEDPLPPLTLNFDPSSRGATFYTIRVVPSGGNGIYEYQWFLGVGSSNTQFESTSTGVDTSEFTMFEDCDKTKYVKLIVTSAGQSVERIIRNGNNPCEPGEDPDNPE